MAIGQNMSKPWHLVNPKIAGKWMFIPLELIIIGFDPPPYYDESSMPVFWMDDNGWFGGTCYDVGNLHMEGFPWFSYIIRGTPNHDLVMDGHDLV